MSRPRFASPPRPGSRLLGILGSLVLLVAPTLAAGAIAAPAAADAPRTVVSLTFDDGKDNAVNAAQVLRDRGLRGTFFVTSGFVDHPGYMTRGELAGIAAGGHEIGGHSVTHPDLTSLSRDEAKRQICNDRVNLTDWGFQVTSLAYPYATSNPVTEALARECGYNSARGLGGTRTWLGCHGCAYAEALPPTDPYRTRAPAQVTNSWTLDNLKSLVTNAENNGGGWVQVTFHDVCGSDCGYRDLSVTPQLLGQFAQWLADRSDRNTVVQTVHEAVGGAVKPAVPGPTVAPAGPGVNAAPNPGLESFAHGGALPRCWMAGGYGVNRPRFSVVPDAHGGDTAVRLTMTGHESGDAKLMPVLDLGECAPAAVPGRTYALSAWYKSTTVTQFAVYYRTAVGNWAYWVSSPWFPATAEYTRAEWTTPALPAGATAISFGLSLFQDGVLYTDDYGIEDTTPAAPPAGSGSLGSVGATTGAATASPVRAGDAVSADARTGIPGPAAPQLYFAPGPQLLQPGQTFLPDVGRLGGRF